ncbi:hypothetical protein [Runella sp.]|uniref:hypothetical protein n=1 Tax=Runella sp. TaxID=1960881 RepID=UPI003D1135DB
MKQLFTFVSLLFSLHVFSQTEKGNSFISGNISTRYSVYTPPNGSTAKSNTFSISTGISYGKFVRDNIVWRTDISESFDRIYGKNGSGSNQTITTSIPNTNISLSSVGLYYFGKERWRGFVGGGVSAHGYFSNIETTTNGVNSRQKRSEFSVTPVFEAGAVYFLNKHLALQLAAATNYFPINISGFSSGLLYWIKPTTFEIDPNEFTTLQKGRWMLGAGFGINTERYKNNNPYYSSTNEERTQRNSIGIEIGKFIKDRTLVGLQLGYSTSKNVYVYNNNLIPNQEGKGMTFSGGIFLKKYLIPARFTPYFGIGVNYMRTKSTYSSGNSIDGSSYANIYELNPNIGLAYVISNHFLVEAQLASLYLNYTPEARTVSVNISGGLRPGFTLSYVF